MYKTSKYSLSGARWPVTFGLNKATCLQRQSRKRSSLIVAKQKLL